MSKLSAILTSRTFAWLITSSFAVFGWVWTQTDWLGNHSSTTRGVQTQQAVSTGGAAVNASEGSQVNITQGNSAQGQAQGSK